uniref:Uncharacterized protein n=1 Tax=Phlebotomus kandelakii TaxID=1109342 RepID=A0A6B2EHY5_9DIPT
MPRRTRDEDIPIKIGGWNGKFVYEKPKVIQEHQESNASGSNPRDQKPIYATGNQFYGYTAEPEVLPVTWDGTFAPSNQTYYRPGRNTSNTSEFYGFCTEPEILPVQWSGKFEMDPNDVRLKPERNQSDVRDYADHRNFVERKPEGQQENGQERQ